MMSLTRHSSKTIALLAAVLVAVTVSSSSFAAVIGLDSSSVSWENSGRYNLTSINVPVLYDAFTFSTFTGADSHRFWADNDSGAGGGQFANITGGDIPTSRIDALSDQSIFTGGFSAGLGPFQFGAVVPVDARIFAFSINTDNTDLIPVDSGGNDVGTLILDVDSSDWGTLGVQDVLRSQGQHVDGRSLRGISFALSDLSGTGDTTQITGFRMTNSGGDPTLIAFATPTVPAPEPSSLALLGLGLIGLCTSRRRQRRAKQ